jgi:catechol 2,3-dioxygenase-like lactoylglutathione lyase family enzyme
MTIRLLTGICAAAALFAQPPVERPRIMGAAHMAYYVSDLNRARSYYRDFLGFEEAFTLKNADGSDHVAFFKINDRQFIVLYAEAPRNYGLLHDVAFETEDAGGLRAYFAARGVKVSADVGKDPAGDLGFDVTDPWGYTIRLVQYEPDSWTARTKGKSLPASRPSTHIDHLGILINDRELAAKYYGENFGFPGEGDKRRIGEGPDRFELGFERKAPTPDRFHIKNHICLSAPDVPKLAEGLKAKTLSRSFQEIETHELTNGKRVAELYDPDGNRIEVMEPPVPGK